MGSLKNYKYLKGSSLVETVIAIAIISVCVLVAFMVYINVISQNKSVAYYQAKHKVEEIYTEASVEQDFGDAIFKYPDYNISKEALMLEDEGIALITFKITTTNQSHTIKKIVAIYDED